MKRYLSYGAGVNSTVLLLTEQYDEVIFVNHGADLPETYDYVKYLKDQGYKITEIYPDFQGYSNFYQYCFDKQFLPSIYLRWCTYRFKLAPIWKYVKVPCEMLVGIAFDERKRAFKKYKKGKAKQINIKYPLIEKQLTRDACIRIIKNHGLKVPVRSGCFFCPFMSPKQVKWLYLNHRELFDKIEALEKNRKEGKHHLLKKPIGHYVPKNMPSLQEYINYE